MNASHRILPLLIAGLLTVNLIQSQSNQYTDPRDGQLYSTVLIKDQLWMSENLNYDTPEGSLYFENNDSYADPFGKLYNWETAQNVCPDGWHLATDQDFIKLETRFGIDPEEAGTIGNRCCADLMVGSRSGFDALLGGYKHAASGEFMDLGSIGYYWTSDEYIFRTIIPEDEERAKVGRIYSTEAPQDYYSVRCLYTETIEYPEIVIDEVDQILTTSFTCSSNVITSGSFTVTEVGLCWGTEPNINIDNSTVIISPDLQGPFEFHVNGLQSNTLYFINSYVKYSLGTMHTGIIYSDKREVRTFPETTPEGDYIVDPRDGNIYRYADFGEQTWMLDDLAYGGCIPCGFMEPPVYMYNEGRYYSWNAGMNLNIDPFDGLVDIAYPHQGVCPDDWHIPSEEEWLELEQFVENSADPSNILFSFNFDAGGGFGSCCDQRYPAYLSSTLNYDGGYLSYNYAEKSSSSTILVGGGWPVDMQKHEIRCISDGESFNTEQGSTISVSPIDPTSQTFPVEVIFTNVLENGNTSLETGSTGPDIPSGFSLGDPPTYYDIQTTATFDGGIQIVLDYSDVTYENESSLRLMHYENDQWMEITEWIDTNNDLIYGIVSSLSPFIILEDLPPVIDAIIAPVDPISVGTTLTVHIQYTDVNPDWANLDWGDGTVVVSEDLGDGMVSFSHQYATSGVYTLQTELADQGGSTDSETYSYVVIYDPDGGFVTGGGWIYSLSGASVLYPNANGKASFGFVAKYKKGANIPTGNTEFQFKAGNLKFNSLSYEWLLIAGEKAKFKGEGTINGSGAYGFMISAIDGDLKDKGDDMFRIKIWDKLGGDIVYDNQIGDTDDGDPTTLLGGGSIVIHGGKAFMKSTSTSEPEAMVNIYPNPFNNSIYVDLVSEASNEIIIEMVDMTGRVIEFMYTGINEANVDHHFELNTNLDLTPGLYMLRIRNVDGEYLGREMILKQ